MNFHEGEEFLGLLSLKLFKYANLLSGSFKESEEEAEKAFDTVFKAQNIKTKKDFEIKLFKVLTASLKEKDEFQISLQNEKTAEILKNLEFEKRAVLLLKAFDFKENEIKSIIN